MSGAGSEVQILLRVLFLYRCPLNKGNTMNTQKMK